MAVEVIKHGNEHKQGNATCPQCGEVVLIEHHWGDLPKCGKCRVPYVFKSAWPKYH